MILRYLNIKLKTKDNINTIISIGNMHCCLFIYIYIYYYSKNNYIKYVYNDYKRLKYFYFMF